MEYCEKSMILTFYFVFLVNVILEILFLFQIPYYHFSIILQSLKIIRILLGIINVLVELFFEVIKYAENLIKKEEQGTFSSSKRYRLYDKIIIIISFIISSFTFGFNITGIVLTSKALDKKESSNLAKSIYVDTIFLLIENIILSFSWLYFLIFWGFNIKDFIKSQKSVDTDIKNKIDKNGSPPPGPSQNQIPSSERQVKNE